METVVSGLPAGKGHIAKSIAFLGDTMIVNFGSATNSCQETDRLPASTGEDPCTELAERAGLWAFARRTHRAEGGRRAPLGHRAPQRHGTRRGSGDRHSSTPAPTAWTSSGRAGDSATR